MTAESLNKHIALMNKRWWILTKEGLMPTKFCHVFGYVTADFDCEGCQRCEVHPI